MVAQPRHRGGRAREPAAAGRRAPAARPAAAAPAPAARRTAAARAPATGRRAAGDGEDAEAAKPRNRKHGRPR